MNIILKGTHHLMKQAEIIKLIESEKPDIMGVELCEARLNYLVINPVKQETIDESLLGKIVGGLKKRAEQEGMKYGEDMITVSRYALDNKIPLLLVDKDVNEIAFMFSKLPENEKNGFLEELTQLDNVSVEESIKEVMNIDEYMKKFKEKYPIGYYLLVELRDLYIANKIMSCSFNNPDKKLVVFLGKGHIAGISKLLDLNN
jgi:pheromone shutdown protein TraB